MRICFFAGAKEINAPLLASLDEGSDATNGDMDFISLWHDEITRFHERTKHRNCMDCGKSFLSTGPVHRLCNIHRGEG